MAKAKKDSSKNPAMSPYSYIAINGAKRTFMFMVFVAGWLGFAFLLYRAQLLGMQWKVMALPVGIVGALLSLCPQSEAWVYQAWQGRSRRYEKHTIV